MPDGATSLLAAAEERARKAEAALEAVLYYADTVPTPETALIPIIVRLAYQKDPEATLVRGRRR